MRRTVTAGWTAWLLCAATLAVYVAASARGLRSYGVGGLSVLAVLAGQVAIVFMRFAIEGGTAVGAARTVAVLNVAILLATRFRPWVIFDVSLLGATKIPQGAKAVSLARQRWLSLGILAVSLTAGILTYSIAGWRFLD